MTSLIIQAVSQSQGVVHFELNIDGFLPIPRESKEKNMAAMFDELTTNNRS